MEIILKARDRRVKRSVKRDHDWYDPILKKMLHFHGGEMRFRYEDGKSVPYVVDHKTWVWENDYDEIVDWVKKFRNKVETLDSARGHFVLIDVDTNDVDEITYDLQRLGILFDWSGPGRLV